MKETGEPREPDLPHAAAAGCIASSRIDEENPVMGRACRPQQCDSGLLYAPVIVYNTQGIAVDRGWTMSLRVHSVAARIARAYVIESDAGLYLVDTGAPGSERIVLRVMRKLGRDDLRLIFITHAHLDHYGSAAALRRLTGAPVAIHRADAETMARGETHLGEMRGWGKVIGTVMRLLEPMVRPEPTKADILISDGDDLSAYGLEAKAVYTPGHTPGSSCLIVGDEHAFVGDMLSTFWGLHAQRFFAADWSLLAGSLRRLGEIKVEWIYAGHGGRPLRGEGLEKINVQCSMKSKDKK